MKCATLGKNRGESSDYSFSDWIISSGSEGSREPPLNCVIGLVMRRCSEKNLENSRGE